MNNQSANKGQDNLANDFSFHVVKLRGSGEEGFPVLERKHFNEDQCPPVATHDDERALTFADMSAMVYLVTFCAYFFVCYELTLKKPYRQLMMLIFGEVMKRDFEKRDKEALARDYMFEWYELSEAAALEGGKLDRRRFFDFLRVYCPWIGHEDIFGPDDDDGDDDDDDDDEGDDDEFTPAVDLAENGFFEFDSFAEWYAECDMDLKRAFLKYDEQERGEIPRDGFYGFLSAVAGLNEREVEDALEDMDTDHGGTVDFGEFKEWYDDRLPILKARREVMMSDIENEKDLLACFNKFDTSDNGVLERNEFEALMGAIAGRDLSNQELDILVKKMDRDSSGFVERGEFIAFFTEECGYPQKASRSDSMLEGYITALCDFLIRTQKRIHHKFLSIIDFKRTHAKALFIEKHLGSGGLSLPKPGERHGAGRSVSIANSGVVFENPVSMGD
jgi:Ca2+-binding EF-hand superfamily protein